MAGVSTPRANFATPRRAPKAPTTDSTPKTQFVTPKRTARAAPSTDTPECFSQVTVETPKPNVRRRSSRDKFDQESNLTVAVRIRPMNSRELAIVGSTNIVKAKGNDLVIRGSSSGVSVDHIFQYDHVFWSCDEKHPQYSTQEDVYFSVGKPLLDSAFSGYNACLFAYGQTGSGKSFSMMGRNTCEIVDIDSEDFSGVTPRFCRDLFDRVNALPEETTASVEVSYFEIYNEKIHDLLAESNSRMPLKVREHPEFGPYVVDLSVHKVKSYKDLRTWLLLGNKSRATAATTMNEKSSRSHAIFTIEINLLNNSEETEGSRRSRVSLVDLAGSERLGNSHNTEEKIKQGVSINKSLLTLGKVISSLADQKRNQFVPYRDSVLTWLLRESLGGNSLTCMLATITPASTHIDETLATLRYACQARSIVNRARINENPHDKMIRELRCEVERLKALRKDYERTSFSSSSVILLNDSSNEELEELRLKLQDTERQLTEAKSSWEQRFIESKQNQLRELAEAEKYKIELESKMRIMKTADTDISLSPFRSNFLQDLEGVLTQEQKVPKSGNKMVDNVIDWCSRNSLVCALSATSLIITDNNARKQATALLNEVSDLNGHENIDDFVNSLAWSVSKREKKLSKVEVKSSLNQIYEILSSLQPSDDENHLNLLYAKVNKALQSFEASLLTSIGKSNQKSVHFNM